MNRMLLLIVLVACNCCAGNIDPHGDGSQYAYGENVGWLNFEPSEGLGVQVSVNRVEGFVWGENIGWINLSPSTYGGVVNDGHGNLTGFAWGENVGWINFDPQVPGGATDYGVTVDDEGYFDGWAYGENIGWIHFDKAKAWSVQACRVSLEDLKNFAACWLNSGSVAGNLDNAGNVNNSDLAIFANYWRDFCPNGWPLK